MSLLAEAQIITFIPTLNPEKARAFYEEMLELKFVSDDGFALVFDAHGTMLRITRVPELTPHPFTVLGWNVADVAMMVDHLTGYGVVFERFDFLQQDEAGVWTAPNGDKVAWFKDPDGNTLSLSQHVKA